MDDYDFVLRRLRHTNVFTKLALRDGSSAVDGIRVKSLLVPKPKISRASFVGFSSSSERDAGPERILVRWRFRLLVSCVAISNLGPVGTKDSIGAALLWIFDLSSVKRIRSPTLVKAYNVSADLFFLRDALSQFDFSSCCLPTAQSELMHPLTFSTKLNGDSLPPAPPFPVFTSMKITRLWFSTAEWMATAMHPRLSMYSTAVMASPLWF
mmetsp:Transcript_32154/g.75625  ORF Transcript_32154/g.75625 Transcript_32154/m.75625 type:complete len:210 (+) Transcript_32154:432-1061(+)